nr:LptA/OstA family protein [uncultured Mitsuokella sp.]
MKNKKMRGVLAAVAAALSLQMGTIYAAADSVPASLDADTLEYDMNTGEATATGYVLLTRGDSKVTSARATYNSKTQAATVDGNVIAVYQGTRLTCDHLMSDGQEHMMATGNVHGSRDDKTFSGEQIDYFPQQNDYIVIDRGGQLTSGDDTFTADRIYGWLKDEHYIGEGNAHVVSPSRAMEAGGDQMDYYGKEQGKAVITGNAWAVQENNTMRSNRMTIYLADDGSAKVQ